MRPSDDTRERTVARLRRGYVTGRLNTETFQGRVDRALQASCGAELQGLTADLPAPPASRFSRLRELLRPALRRRAYLPPLESLTAGRVVLGRSSACQIVFADDTVSRRHAELRLVEGRWMLRDLGSSNGTWVNGRRVLEAEVTAGDEVHLGGCRFRM
jgi:hypothetical protein